MITLEGRPVFDTEPEFFNPPRRIPSRGYTQAKVGFAASVAAFPGVIAFHAMNHDYLFTSRAQIQAFTDFFEAQSGTWADFWLPSWHGELNPVANLANGDTTLSITPVGYNAAYLTDTDTTRLGRYLWVRHIDGTQFISAVSSCADGTPEVLTLATPAPRDFVLGQFIVGFLYLVRFQQDDMAVTFDSPNVATAKCAFLEVMQTIATADAS